MSSPLGSLEPVDHRTNWPDEARDSTPWLAQEENLRRLSDALNLELELGWWRSFIRDKPGIITQKHAGTGAMRFTARIRSIFCGRLAQKALARTTPAGNLA
jgi:hypothetical protein